MSTKRFAPARLAGVVSIATLIAGFGISSNASAKNDTPKNPPNIVDVVIDVSGAEGTDHNGKDYDLLRDALVATGLAEAVATADDITVFAPNDRAFIRLARDLGYSGRDEAGAFGFLAEFTGFQSADEPGLLDDVLLYHVAPGAQSRRELNRSGPIDTLLGAPLEVERGNIIDGDSNDRDSRIVRPFDLKVSNGVIHTVNRVLRPIDLEPAPPSENIVEIVLAASGTEGTDDNGKDYDLLRDALVATGLAEAVATSEDITVFAPNDRAFIRLARDLGFGGRDEAGAFAFLAAATGYVSAEEPGLLDDVLLYHVAPGARTVKELESSGDIGTLQGGTLQVEHRRVIDADTDDRNARIVKPKNLEASNGIIQTVNRVLRPIDL